MACFHPYQAFVHGVKSDGKKDLSFKRKSRADKEISLPCRKCSGCRLDYSRQWAIRCVHEASLYENNCFVTLTFNEESMFVPGVREARPESLDHREFQLFIKRLRKRYGNGIRYYMSGEYGDENGRPHYHALLFNFDFSDKYLWKNQRGRRLYRSPALESLWSDPESKLSFGYSSVGDVTFESAAYVARYIMKKVSGPIAEEHYERVDLTTGEIFSIKPEYSAMSRRPGIGSKWFDLYSDDVYPSDFVVFRDKKMKPPKFYDSMYQLADPISFASVKTTREVEGDKYAWNCTPDRLAVREKCFKANVVDKLSRELY